MTDKELSELWCSIPTVGHIDADVIAFGHAIESRVLAERKPVFEPRVIEDYGQNDPPVVLTHPTPDDASDTYREVGVWDTDGRKFRTYAAENLNGKAMYVRDAAMQADKVTK